MNLAMNEGSEKDATPPNSSSFYSRVEQKDGIGSTPGKSAAILVARTSSKDFPAIHVPVTQEVITERNPDAERPSKYQ